MRIIRYLSEDSEPVLAALTSEETVYPLEQEGFIELIHQANAQKISPLSFVQHMISKSKPIPQSIEELSLLVPIIAQEVWASGVTYERSRDARNYEATDGKLDATTFYDKVYDAERPEIFFKSTAARTVGPNQEVYIRSDSKWQIPEPELGLIISQEGEILGYTIGNDMSCRDIEGENPLYLPQAKMWKHSCSIGPAILLTESVKDPYDFDIICRIYRHGNLAVEGTASTRQLKRKFEELVSFLVRDNEIFDGTVLLTGTCIVPPNDFTLLEGDQIEIEIPSIGILKNSVRLPSKISV
ncbi:fumarylacetoacetate hydrolase family protein [Priestia megaterium]|uniref:Fumarylacetoacetate (FAA) hydrolase family protein n=1 Tax=Priestia megaterium (strain ATCC 14581 / DSM 32 / CCUG 1817 / JCM 2506 / NBRC 15308 / NCIMB 9376 / NCTC 10342 / NRRL B-14308 / VKM B-512 / Ford 19) TaxID=1348623 RepID=A0A0B6AHY6_PRIM2|nr:fumarylacetoacetate hydrolase family protein [Priestia megaterium]AJI24475.1 fumarylacetoacetate (FAA) hydrolase family protein [Priestia megaterium NBRC 15308 = ATCC 14581]KFM98280.1 fumarylacetoacetate (FAA) hydrolase family protein [Priestia megaterium]KGJ78468.1 fumarylacetoacetate hydrolase [Priestia megaterium NBRC 15308 = ATCC 14581]MDR4232663.1 fumarylacetoacetate hydrolase [Priestia megaterium]MED3809483.1 fumarylacetoacetate hydrolase family protein [Priestia megaterium]